MLTAKVQALQDQKLKELQDKNKALQAAQEKLEKGGERPERRCPRAAAGGHRAAAARPAALHEDAQQEVQR